MNPNRGYHNFITTFHSDEHAPPYIPDSQFHQSTLPILLTLPPTCAQASFSLSRSPVSICCTRPSFATAPKKLHNPSWRPTSLLGHRHHSATRYSATNGILQASAANFTTLQDTVIRFPTETCCMEPYPTICTQATHMVPELSWHHPALPYTLAHASAHRTYAPAASNHPRPVA